MTTQTTDNGITFNSHNQTLDSIKFDAATHDNLIVDGTDNNQYILSISGSKLIATKYQARTQTSEQHSCYYCGMPAKSFTFFGAPVCKGCGG
jgi:hypothetical protein